MPGSLFIVQIGSFYELRDQAYELLQTSNDAGILANAALALYPNGGCSIVFGPGTFNCSQITINQPNTRIEGSGTSTIIQPIGNNSVFYLTSPSGNGTSYVQLGNFQCKDTGLMTGNSAFFYFNAYSGMPGAVLDDSLFHDITFAGTCNRAFYDGGGTGNILTGAILNSRFFAINSSDANTIFNNTFFSIQNFRQSIFSQGVLILSLPTSNTSLFSIGAGATSGISNSSTIETLQAYITNTGYTGTALAFNQVNALHVRDVAILFIAPPTTTTTGMSISGSLGEVVFRRLKIYSANVGILFTSSSDIGFSYLANGCVFEDVGIFRCNTSIKCVSDSTTKFFVGGQLLPNTGGVNFSPNPLSGTPQLHNVQGVNPIGIATISVGASPFTYTNNDGVPEAIYITGGTVTGVTKNSTSLGVLTTVFLEPSEQITITYTSTPNMFKDQKG
jgi:hypothetical protein